MLRKATIRGDGELEARHQTSSPQEIPRRQGQEKCSKSLDTSSRGGNVFTSTIGEGEKEEALSRTHRAGGH